MVVGLLKRNRRLAVYGLGRNKRTILTSPAQLTTNMKKVKIEDSVLLPNASPWKRAKNGNFYRSEPKIQTITRIVWQTVSVKELPPNEVAVYPLKKSKEFRKLVYQKGKWQYYVNTWETGCEYGCDAEDAAGYATRSTAFAIDYCERVLAKEESEYYRLLLEFARAKMKIQLEGWKPVDPSLQIRKRKRVAPPKPVEQKENDWDNDDCPF